MLEDEGAVGGHKVPRYPPLPVDEPPLDVLVLRLILGEPLVLHPDVARAVSTDGFGCRG